jgi:hypothetical protein
MSISAATVTRYSQPPRGDNTPESQKRNFREWSEERKALLHQATLSLPAFDREVRALR